MFFNFIKFRFKLLLTLITGLDNKSIKEFNPEMLKKYNVYTVWLSASMNASTDAVIISVDAENP